MRLMRFNYIFVLFYAKKSFKSQKITLNISSFYRKSKINKFSFYGEKKPFCFDFLKEFIEAHFFCWKWYLTIFFQSFF